MSAQQAHSQKLIQCLINLEKPDLKFESKNELMDIVSDLMPGGSPRFMDVKQFISVAKLVESYNRKTISKVLFLLVKDFCDTLNVKQNMSEDQMIEAARLLLDECGKFRLEDYLVMFTLGKRGHLVKIYERIDLNVISQMIDVYYHRMRTAENEFYESQVIDDERRWNEKPTAPTTEEEKEMSDRFGKLLGVMEAWKEDPDLRSENDDTRRAAENQKKIQEYAATNNVDIDAIYEEYKEKKPFISPEKKNRITLALNKLQKEFTEGKWSQNEYREKRLNILN